MSRNTPLSQGHYTNDSQKLRVYLTRSCFSLALLASSMADTSSAEAQGLHDLCLSAFTAEYKHDHQSAASLHGSSVEHLTQALQRTGRFEHNKKRVLRRKIKIHEGRLRNLNIQHAAPFVLVVPQNRQDIIEEQLQRGVAKIGLVSKPG